MFSKTFIVELHVFYSILQSIEKELLLDFNWGNNTYPWMVPANQIFEGNFSAVRDYAANGWLMYVQRLFLMLAQVNLALAVFNLLPVPPLDGFRVLDQFVFKGELRMTQQTMQYIYIGFMIVLLSGALSGLLGTVNTTVYGWLCKGFALLI